MIFLGKVSFFHLYVIRAGGPIWVVFDITLRQECHNFKLLNCKLAAFISKPEKCQSKPRPSEKSRFWRVSLTSFPGLRERALGMRVGLRHYVVVVTQVMFSVVVSFPVHPP